MSDRTHLYSDRVEAYEHGRPGYPDESLARLPPPAGANGRTRTVADLGAGTGILSRQLLRHGYHVIAVEPDDAMRRQADRVLGGDPGYRSVGATAERTTLAAGSVDLATAGQALHWFDADRTRRELARIVRPGGTVLLLWNDLWSVDDAVTAALDRLFRDRLPTYVEDRERDPDVLEMSRAVLDPGAPVQSTRHPHRQYLGREEFRSRFLSMSYAPGTDDPARESLAEQLDLLFERHREECRVRLDYQTVAVTGRPKSGEGDRG